MTHTTISSQRTTILKLLWRSFSVAFVALGLLLTVASSYSEAQAAGVPTKTIYVQTMDSCQHAMGGSSFQLTGNGLRLTAGPASGTGIHFLIAQPTACPIQRASCSRTTVGCVSFVIPVPRTGTVTYTLVETVTAPNSVPCDGGSVCPGGPVTATITINTAGVVSATVRNVDPDGSVVIWPTSGTYAATPADPIVVHDFMLGTGSCDGDHDADDRLTGSPSRHCDSDHDRH